MKDLLVLLIVFLLIAGAFYLDYKAGFVTTHGWKLPKGMF